MWAFCLQNDADEISPLTERLLPKTLFSPLLIEYETEQRARESTREHSAAAKRNEHFLYVCVLVIYYKQTQLYTYILCRMNERIGASANRRKSYKYAERITKKLFWLLWFRWTSELVELFRSIFGSVSFLQKIHWPQRAHATRTQRADISIMIMNIVVIYFMRQRAVCARVRVRVCVWCECSLISGWFHVQRSRHATTDSLHGWLSSLTLNGQMTAERRRKVKESPVQSLRYPNG